MSHRRPARRPASMAHGRMGSRTQLAVGTPITSGRVSLRVPLVSRPIGFEVKNIPSDRAGALSAFTRSLGRSVGIQVGRLTGHAAQSAFTRKKKNGKKR